jgi:hypothetical protein
MYKVWRSNSTLGNYHTFTHTPDSLWQHCFDYFAHNQSLFYLCIEFILEILLLTLKAYLHKTVLILQNLCFITCIKWYCGVVSKKYKVQKIVRNTKNDRHTKNDFLTWKKKWLIGLVYNAHSSCKINDLYKI